MIRTCHADKPRQVLGFVDECPKTAANYGVRSIPTLLLIREGNVRETLIGMTTKEKLAAFIDRNLAG